MSLFMEIILSIALILLVLWWLYNINKSKQFYKNIPGPPTIPFLGNALDFTDTTELLNLFSKYAQNYGGIVKIQIGPWKKAILVTDYKFLEFVLTSTKLLKKSEDYKFVGPWLGTGLLTGDGPKWKSHRRILTPAFHSQILEQFVDIFDSCGNILTEKLKKIGADESLDIHPFITMCTLDIICESTMGISINAQENDNSDYVRSVKNMCRIVIERSMAVLQRYDFFHFFSKNYQIQKKALRILHAKANDVINKKRSIVQNDEIFEDFDAKNKKTFLDILLEATIDDQPLSQDEIREEVDTLMFAGHDTTAAALSFTLYCLANHPDIQKKVFQELVTIFGSDKNPVITYKDLQAMKYLEQVIKETMRLYPSVPIYCRQSSKDVIYNNQRLPDEDSIIIFAYGMHRNPDYFQDPETFNPDRFENNNKLPYAYVPFSAGSRNCIGQKFAMLEMKCIISKILLNFELKQATPEHRLKLAAETVLTSTNGVKMKLSLRDSS